MEVHCPTGSRSLTSALRGQKDVCTGWSFSWQKILQLAAKLNISSACYTPDILSFNKFQQKYCFQSLKKAHPWIETSTHHFIPTNCHHFLFSQNCHLLSTFLSLNVIKSCCRFSTQFSAFVTWLSAFSVRLWVGMDGWGPTMHLNFPRTWPDPPATYQPAIYQPSSTPIFLQPSLSFAIYQPSSTQEKTWELVLKGGGGSTQS